MDLSRKHRIKYKILADNLFNYVTKLGIKPETEIDIYLDYPFGWHGVFGAYNRVYIFQSRNGIIRLKDIQPVYGFNKFGRLILKGENR